MISFEDLNLIFYIQAFIITIEVIINKEGKIQTKQHFATTFRPLTQKLWYVGAFFGSTLPCLHPLQILLKNSALSGILFFTAHCSPQSFGFLDLFILKKDRFISSVITGLLSRLLMCFLKPMNQSYKILEYRKTSVHLHIVSGHVHIDTMKFWPAF
jgi:hypothetical protein